MPRFATVPQEAEDELLYSFLMRTARANGFNNTKLFFDCYHLKKPGQSITYEYRWDIYRLIEAISKKNEDVVKFYLKTEMFSGIAPFATRELTSHRIGVFHYVLSVSKVRINKSFGVEFVMNYEHICFYDMQYLVSRNFSDQQLCSPPPKSDVSAYLPGRIFVRDRYKDQHSGLNLHHLFSHRLRKNILWLQLQKHIIF